jgi:hypothetical protein
MARAKNSQESTAVNLGFETTLWAAADKLRNNMDAAEYKDVVPGLFFSNIYLMHLKSDIPILNRNMQIQRADGTLQNLKPNIPSLKTRMSTGRRISSGYQRNPGGCISSRTQNNRDCKTWAHADSGTICRGSFP